MASPLAPAHAGLLEAGTFTAHDTLGSNQTPDAVFFQEPFDVPPVVVAVSDSTGNNSASIRIASHSGDGTAPNIRFIRIQPEGILSAQISSGPPNFELRLSAKIR